MREAAFTGLAAGFPRRWRSLSRRLSSSDEARRAKYQGEVMVQLIVDAQGNRRTRVSFGRWEWGSMKKALEAVMKYKFKPRDEGWARGSGVPDNCGELPAVLKKQGLEEKPGFGWAFLLLGRVCFMVAGFSLGFSPTLYRLCTDIFGSFISLTCLFSFI